MNRIIGSLSIGFGSTWIVQSGALSAKPEVVVDKGRAIIGSAVLGLGLYCVGANNGFNHGYRVGTQQVIRHNNDYRKGFNSNK